MSRENLKLYTSWRLIGLSATCSMNRSKYAGTHSNFSTKLSASFGQFVFASNLFLVVVVDLVAGSQSDSARSGYGVGGPTDRQSKAGQITRLGSHDASAAAVIRGNDIQGFDVAIPL